MRDLADGHPARADDRSEGAGERYDCAVLERLELEVEGHGAIDRVGAYLSRRGPLAQKAGRCGSPVTGIEP